MKGCEAFAKLIKEYNGRLPGDYEGAYEKWLKRNGKVRRPRKPMMHIEKEDTEDESDGDSE